MPNHYYSPSKKYTLIFGPLFFHLLCNSLSVPFHQHHPEISDRMLGLSLALIVTWMHPMFLCFCWDCVQRIWPPLVALIGECKHLVENCPDGCSGCFIAMPSTVDNTSLCYLWSLVDLFGIIHTPTSTRSFNSKVCTNSGLVYNMYNKSIVK